jgi:hypothetical protein
MATAMRDLKLWQRAGFGADANRVLLEVTESGAMKDLRRSAPMM